MHLKRITSHRVLLMSLVMALALIFSACGDNDGVQVEDPAVGIDTEAPVAGEADVDTEADIDTEAEPVATEESEAESVETEVETQVITDTDVITQTEVFTEAIVTEVVTETNVMTDVNEGNIIDSDVMTETADLGTTTSPVQVQGSEQEGQTAGFVIVVVPDAQGNEFLSDASNQRPLFAQTDASMGMIEDENFEPVGINENISIAEDLDQSLFGVVDQNGFQQLTINGYPIYRYVGDEADLSTMTQEQGLMPLTREGEVGELSQ